MVGLWDQSLKRRGQSGWMGPVTLFCFMSVSTNHVAEGCDLLARNRLTLNANLTSACKLFPAGMQAKTACLENTFLEKCLERIQISTLFKVWL